LEEVSILSPILNIKLAGFAVLTRKELKELKELKEDT
jgi:hypothetical protein